MEQGQIMEAAIASTQLVKDDTPTMEPLEHGGSYNRLVSIFKDIKHAVISNYYYLVFIPTSSSS